MNESDTTDATYSLPEAEGVVLPTYAPAALAMGITMTLWGLLTHWSMSLIGAGLGIWALWNWIQEIVQSRRSL